MLQALRRRHLARSIVVAALFSLAAAMGLAHWHALTHGPGAPVLGQGAHGASEAKTPEPWGHSAGDVTCQLVDQLLIGLATAPPPTMALAEVCPPGRVSAVCPAAARGIVAAFLARAPPRG